MTKHLIYLIISLSLFGCASEGEEVYYLGESIIHEIEIDFDESSITFNDWHNFKLNYSNNLSVTFSKGEFSDSLFTISAREYKSDSLPIKLTVAPISEGSANFEMEYIESSPGLNAIFSDIDSIEYPEIVIKRPISSIVYFVLILIVVLAALTFWWVRKTKKEKSFYTGSLYFTFPLDIEITLRGKSEINLGKCIGIKEDGCLITCEPALTYDGSQSDGSKRALLEITPGYKLFIRGEIPYSDTPYLKDDDKVIIKDELDLKIIEFIYYQ
jgi:hypothetical protein